MQRGFRSGDGAEIHHIQSDIDLIVAQLRLTDMQRHESVVQIDIGIHILILLHDRQFCSVGGRVAPHRKSFSIFDFVVDLKPARERPVRGAIEIAARSAVFRVACQKEVDRKSPFVEVIEFFISSGLGAEKTAASGADLVDLRRDLLAACVLRKSSVILVHHLPSPPSPARESDNCSHNHTKGDC